LTNREQFASAAIILTTYRRGDPSTKFATANPSSGGLKFG
jgi:hypothetical protein